MQEKTSLAGGWLKLGRGIVQSGYLSAAPVQGQNANAEWVLEE